MGRIRWADSRGVQHDISPVEFSYLRQCRGESLALEDRKEGLEVSGYLSEVRGRDLVVLVRTLPTLEGESRYLGAKTFDDPESFLDRSGRWKILGLLTTYGQVIDYEAMYAKQEARELAELERELAALEEAERSPDTPNR